MFKSKGTEASNSDEDEGTWSSQKANSKAKPKSTPHIHYIKEQRAHEKKKCQWKFCGRREHGSDSKERLKVNIFI